MYDVIDLGVEIVVIVYFNCFEDLCVVLFGIGVEVVVGSEVIVEVVV